MKNIFIESVNGYDGLDDAQKGAIVSLYRTLFEDGAGHKPATKEKTDDKKEEKKEEKKEDKKDEPQGNDKDSGKSEGEPLNMSRNRTPINVQRTDKREVEYIALHYTAGGSSKPGQAKRTQFPKDKKASADFIVDDAEIYQYNPDLDHYYTFAVGAPGGKKEVEKYKAEAQSRGMNDAAQLYGSANYKNTLSIEMCSNYKGGIKDIKTTSAIDPNYYLTEATLANTAKLVAWLLTKYPGARIIRHYDITGKPCPGPWCRDNAATQQFLAFVQRCNSTPAPSVEPQYEDVEDMLLEKDDLPPWPDFARQFAPDKTATAIGDEAASATEIGTLDGLVKSIDNPVVKVLAGVIKKNNGKVPNAVIKEFVQEFVKNPGMLKNVLKIVQK